MNQGATVNPLPATRPAADGVQAGRLRSAGLRATNPRVLVLSAIAALAHPTIEELHQHLRGTRVDVSTVYRTLSRLERAGLVGRLHMLDGVMRYHPVHDHADADADADADDADDADGDGDGGTHLHLWCRGCEQVLDVPAGTAHQAVDAAVAAAGLRADAQQLTVTGLCRACRDRT